MVVRAPSRTELIVTAAIGFVLIVVGALWLDAQRYHGRVLRHVRVAGHDIGGMDSAALDRFIDDLESDYQRQRVRVAVPGGGFSTTVRLPSRSQVRRL